jgi:hypothetical protein
LKTKERLTILTNHENEIKAKMPIVKSLLDKEMKKFKKKV